MVDRGDDVIRSRRHDRLHLFAIFPDDGKLRGVL